MYGIGFWKICNSVGLIITWPLDCSLRLHSMSAFNYSRGMYTCGVAIISVQVSVITYLGSYVIITVQLRDSSEIHYYIYIMHDLR